MLLEPPVRAAIYSPIYSPLLGKRASSLTPDLALFAKYGQPGFLFNFAHTDRTFQEATGQTLADDAGEAVALALDEAQWGAKTLAQLVAEQPELVKANLQAADFTSGVNNIVVTDESAGVLRFTNTAGGAATVTLPLAQALTAGVRYHISFEVFSPSSNTTQNVGRIVHNSANVISSSSEDAWQNKSMLSVHSSGLIVQVASASAHASAGDYFLARNISVKEIPGYHGIQSGSTGARPTRQAGGVVQFDAVDDNLLTTLAGGASGNTIIVRMAVPGTIASTQVVAGFSAASDGRFQLAVNTSGQICAGVGANSTTGHVIATDRLGQTGVAALVEDGTNVKLYWNGVEGNSAARNGAPDTATPYRIGGNNGNGTAGAFFGGSIYQALAIQAAITPAEALSISNYWNSL